MNFKGAYGGWGLSAGSSTDNENWTLTISVNPGTYEWGAEDQSQNWLGTDCEDLDGTRSDSGSNCQFTVSENGTVSGATKIHKMV